MNYTIRTAAAVASVVAGLASTAVFAQSPVEEQTSQTILAQLDKDAALHADTLHVETVGNVVYLTGQVDTALESEDAERAALSVPHVAKVVNQLSYGSNG